MTRQTTLFSAFIIVFTAAAASAQYSVWIDMASIDTTSGLTNASCCDGNTQAANVGGLDCRKNVNTATDTYFYFDISDSFALAGNHPDLWITVHYYDNGTGNIALQYDAASTAYKNAAASVTLASSNTWKAFGWHVTDGYFGNRQNGGADFRISRSTTGDFYMDLAYVRDYCPGAPCVSMVPQPGWNTNAQPFRDLFEQAAQWTTARNMVDTIGYYDHRINTFSDAELSVWLPQIHAWGKKFAIETGAVKSFCHGQTCFDSSKPTYDRFVSLGATPDIFNMDEPLTAVHANSLGTDAYAEQETATWMQLVRQNYPNARIVSIEAYPYLSQTTLQNWIRDLNNRCAVIGIQGLDGFMLDPDWRAFSGGSSWSGVKALETYCHNRGVPFSNIYWASAHSNSTNDCDWTNDITTEGTAYRNASGTPDEYNIESWMNIPVVTVPDTANCSFTKSIKDFVNTFVPQSAPGVATTPNPSDGAVGVSINPSLSWAAGSNATSHDVYLGTSSPGTFRGNQAGTTYNPSTLLAGTVYYWRIDEKNTGGTTTGPVWSFTTGLPPGQAVGPSPASGTTGLDTTVSLSWTAVSAATSHDVYFGTTSPGTFQGNQTDTTFNPPTLTIGTLYYWRINEKNAYGTTTGTIWTIRTVSVPRADFDGDGDVDSSDFGHLQNCLNSGPPDVSCEDADLNASNTIDVADFNIFQPCMAGPNHAPGC